MEGDEKMNLTDEQKNKTREAYNKLKPEEQEKLKNELTKLSDEDLNKVNGGGLLDILVDTMGDALSPVVDAFVEALRTVSLPVEGPKVSTEKCSICNLPIPTNQMKDHILNVHKQELEEFIKNSPIF